MGEAPLAPPTRGTAGSGDLAPDKSSIRSRCIEPWSMATRTLESQRSRLETVVERVSAGDGVLDGLRLLRPLGEEARRADAATAVRALTPLIDGYRSDPLASYLGIHALAGVVSDEVNPILLRCLTNGHSGLAEHASWALSRRRPQSAALPALVELAGSGGFRAMMAELALETWFAEIPELIWQVERPVPERIRRLADRPRFGHREQQGGQGLRIAQILMQGRVDAELSAAGSGDGGGLVTLQVGLTEELAEHESVSEVFLITRQIEGESTRFRRPLEPIGSKGTLVRLPFGPSGYLPTSEMWAFRADIERELRSFLTGHGMIDALHLRFADVGTFVGARLGIELGIPIIFTLAPDPHAVVTAAEGRGALTRGNFAAVDAEQHYVFRAWLVEWMLEHATRLTLLPRQNQVEQFRTLLGIDLSTDPDRFRVIPEGVDYAMAADARQVLSSPGSLAEEGVLADLRRGVEAMPESRRGLPVILSVGRLHRVKGMDRVTAAWRSDPQLHSQFNLVLLGGNLEDPSPEERATMSAIESAASEPLEAANGLLLLGSRSHHEVVLVMAAAVAGIPDVIGPNGIYVCGSDKEEFGLAIVEAMAAGLPVVAPEVGGPATYLEPGFTGYLSDTGDVASIQAGLRWADGVRSSQVRADSARRLVRSKYSLSAMARELVDLYADERAEPSVG
jgi:glycosyltransferase involved in cell wall biosynthesis